MSEAETLESMIKATEELLKDLPACFHWEWISVQKYFPAEVGTRYMCIRCHKLCVIPDHMFVTRQKEQTV